MLGRLFRWRLALMNGVSAVAGYQLAPGPVYWLQLLALFSGVSVMAAGSSALNQVIERDRDLLMERTRNRPLPMGQLRPSTVACIGVGCLVAGYILLAAMGGATPAVTGLAIALFYLAVYTPLKRRTAFSLLIGAICGAATPVIGWTFAVGKLVSFPVLLLALLLYLWQVPHFWMLQRRHLDDFRRAGFVILELPEFPLAHQLLFALWCIAVVAAVLMFPLFGVIDNGSAVSCLFLSVPLLLFLSRRLEPALFTYLNLFPLLLLAVIWNR